METAVKPPRFPITGCSQCGKSFGPGNSGFSHCKNHKGLMPLTARQEAAADFECIGKECASPKFCANPNVRCALV